MRKKKSTMIYGLRAVMEAMESGNDLEKVFIQKNLVGDLSKELMQKMVSSYTPFIKVPVERLNKFTGKNHQGVVAFLSPIKYHSLSNLVATIFESGELPLILVLDRITDVRNFGAIARTAEGFGVHGIVIPSKGAAQINEDSLKTSAGALSIIPIVRENNLTETVEYLQNSGFQVIACTEKTTREIFDIEMGSNPVALIMGSEEDGISDDILSLSIQRAKIPIPGQMSSFNVSVSAGISIYEVIRQRS